MTGRVVDLFAGPGGWSEGLRMLGLSDIGVEWDHDACRTRAAAGHLTVRADVSQYPPEAFGDVWGLIASPPCPDFSVAGSGKGRSGSSGWLIDAPPTWVEALRPEWIACEQVPPALPVWRHHAELYRRMGYSVWTGIVNAANFGVPQTRKRALLLASRTGAALPPEPTHGRSPAAGLFGGHSQWVTMADALGWTGTVDQRQQADGVPKRLIPSHEPAPTLTGTAGAKSQWVMLRHSFAETSPDSWTDHRVPADRPAPTIDTKARAWCWERPATTVCADPRLSQPGWRGKPSDYDGEGNYTGARSMDDAVRLTIEEAFILQSFDPAYPWQGSRSSQFTQVGNAVPPLLAAHVLSSLTGVPFTADLVEAS